MKAKYQLNTEHLQQLQSLEVMLQQDALLLRDIGVDLAFLSRRERDTSHLEAIRKKVAARITTRQAARDRIIHIMQQMKNEKYRVFLYKRFVEGKQMERVAEEMCYSYDYIKGLTHEALTAFAEVCRELLEDKAW